MKIKIIYNPKAGKHRGLKNIKALSNELLNDGHLVQRVATKEIYDTDKATKKAIEENFDLIIAAGGDGTINEAASALAEKNSKIPLGIFQFGTVNDFANYINITNDPKKYAQLVNEMATIEIDLGKIDNRYFINVAAGGILTSVAHDTPREMKAVLGKNAYYLHGLKDLTEKGIYSSNLTIKYDNQVVTDDFYLFLISNSPSIGGFDKFAPDAEIHDGLLNCVFVKKAGFINGVEIFIQILQGKHIDNQNVLYFKTSEIEVINNSKNDVEYDIDGEYGGNLPITVEVVPSAINILI